MELAKDCELKVKEEPEKRGNILIVFASCMDGI